MAPETSNILGKMVGAERFELPTSCSRSKRATKLRYAPIRVEETHTLPERGGGVNGKKSWVACYGIRLYDVIRLEVEK